MRLARLGCLAVLVASACVIGEPESQVSRFELTWSLSSGQSCAEAGIERVQLQSTLRSEDVPEVFADELPCEDGEGLTHALAPGRYELRLVGLSAAGGAVGLSQVRVDIELGRRETVVLEPFVVEITP